MESNSDRGTLREKGILQAKRLLEFVGRPFGRAKQQDKSIPQHCMRRNRYILAGVWWLVLHLLGHMPLQELAHAPLSFWVDSISWQTCLATMKCSEACAMPSHSQLVQPLVSFRKGRILCDHFSANVQRLT